MFIVTFPFRSFHFETSQKEITADICITQLKKEKKMENEGELAKFRGRSVVSVSDHRVEMPAGPPESDPPFTMRCTYDVVRPKR